MRLSMFNLCKVESSFSIRLFIIIRSSDYVHRYKEKSSLDGSQFCLFLDFTLAIHPSSPELQGSLLQINSISCFTWGIIKQIDCLSRTTMIITVIEGQNSS